MKWEFCFNNLVRYKLVDVQLGDNFLRDITLRWAKESQLMLLLPCGDFSESVRVSSRDRHREIKLSFGTYVRLT